MITSNSHPFTKTLVSSALLVMGLLKITVVPSFAQSGTWTKTGSMKNDRDGAAAVLLQDGRVLVAGGGNSTGQLTSAEL